MAISDSQKVDLLYKKVGFSVSKTDASVYKSPSNESIASLLLVPGDNIWQLSANIPATIPSGNVSVVNVYSDALTSTVECVPDATSHPQNGVYPSWLTNLKDWIPSSFGATYQVKVYSAAPGVSNPQTVGVQLFSDGSGNSDAWYFDYQSGVLNFLDTNIPSSLTSSNHIYIVGARYTGQKGLGSFPNGLSIGNIAINGNTITNANLSFAGNVNILPTTNSISNTTGALTVAGGASIQKDLWVGGNVYANALVSENIQIMSVADPLLYLTANSSYPYDYEVGMYSHFVGGTANIYQHTGVVRSHTDNNWHFFSNVIAEPTIGTVNLADPNIIYDTIHAGALVLSNTTPSVSTATGALYVAGGASLNGNLYLTGNIVSTASGYFTIPTGNTAQRPSNPQLGMIRYNSTISSYEGFGAGSAWASLGGVKSVDGHAYITAEAYAAAGDDVLRFYAGDTGVSTQVMWVSNANVSILSNTISTSSTTGALQVIGGVGVIGNVNVGGNITTTAISTDNHLYANGVSIITTLDNVVSTANTAMNNYVGALNSAMTANVTAANAAIVTANTAVVNYVNTLNSAMASNVAGANAAIVTANTAMQNYVTAANSAVVSYVNTQTTSLATGANANTAAYLTTYTGNISANQFTGNVVADTITPNATPVTVFNSNTAVGLPLGTTANRPANPTNGYLRYNTDLGSLEIYSSSTWMPLGKEVSTQSVVGDGVSNTFTLNQTTNAEGIIVSINGTLQQPYVAYTVSGNQITFAETPLSTDTVELRFISTAVSFGASITGNLLASGNITASYFVGNAALLTGINTNPAITSIQSTVSKLANVQVVTANNVTVGTANIIIDSFDVSQYRSAKYLISSTNNYDQQFAELMLLQGNSTVYTVTYAILNTGANIVTFYSNISGTTVNLIAQGTINGNSLKIQRTYFAN